MAQFSTFPRSRLLILCPNSVQSLLPVTPISRAEALLESHRIEDVIQLADQQRKKVQARLVVDANEVDELAYVYQKIGMRCLFETRFEDAGFCLFQGELDPRILISYFPDLRGALLDGDPTLDVFAGVAECMPPYDSIDDIILANLVLNYSPFLAPTTRSAPPTTELRRLLRVAAYDMLEVFLRKWRRVRGDSGTPALRSIVDTVLAKLFAQGEKTTDLYSLIAESDVIILPEVEPVFRATGRYSALCKIYSKRGHDAPLLEVWSKLVEGEWTDDEIPDPLSDMFALLTTRRDRALIQQWGVWLAGKDVERALKLLTAQSSAKRGKKAEDEAAMLERIRAVNPDAAARFLEHLVLQKRRTDPSLHTELALTYVGDVISLLSDEATSRLWRAKASSYASSPSPVSFFAYFEATTPASRAKHARLRTALFLQTSSTYDASAARARLAPLAPLLAPELAIIAGKLGDAQEALSLLARTVHDHTSAAAFCTSRGAVIPPRAAAHLAELAGLAAWAPAPPAAAAADAPVENTEETKRLLHILLAIYTADATPSATHPDKPPQPHPCASPSPSPSPSQQSTSTPTPPTSAAEAAAAQLLSSHATSFDPPTVLSMIPPRWPIRTISLYLVRALRIAAHAAHERALVKALATGQNLAVTDAAHAQLRAAGALIEEAVDEDEDDGVAEVDGGGEGDLVLDEKAALGSGVPASMAVDLPVRGKTERADADAGAGAGAGAEAEVVGSWMSGRTSVDNRD
ncbi:hypothetical protein F5148DRAFT_1148443 [Russula earlei]|uniref:Uncharacterized protein n=1 Tax=Russula earlei TaxID=71964 RepID=A0ACC0UEM3_9AGAM|nr:hypothetical protein F5148DRAFT_1148443 [Russula earlei]